MLYALVLFISTTSRIQQFTPGPDWPVQVGSSYMATVKSQQLIAYYETERACQYAARHPNPSWPPRAEGQTIRPVCVATDTQLPPQQPPALQPPTSWAGPAWPGAWWRSDLWPAPWWGGGW
ncbi:hypothetical protein [Xanthobacter sediminis]